MRSELWSMVVSEDMAGGSSGNTSPQYTYLVPLIFAGRCGCGHDMIPLHQEELRFPITADCI